MIQALDNSLYMRDRKQYDAIRKKALQFTEDYVGSNIIRDTVFQVLKNYISQNGLYPQLFLYPFEDEDFCACTFIKGGRVFVVINTDMALSKQIFAAAHELFHLFKCFEDEQSYLSPSILDSATLDEKTTKLEDMEANAFAGLILAPRKSLLEQMDIYHIRRNSIGVKEILTLMEIYAMPWKAVVFRLFEDEIITKDKARELLQISKSEIEQQSELTGQARKWQRNTEHEISFGSLLKNMNRVFELKAVDRKRYHQDEERVNAIRREVSKKS